ncbi:hypothetical protein Tco_1541463 [Tanacetum coccineum]
MLGLWNSPRVNAPPDTSVVETPQESWTLFTDRSSYVDGSGAVLILTSPKGTEFTYALRFQFTASNDKAEYEALIPGLQIAAQDGSTQCTREEVRVGQHSVPLRPPERNSLGQRPMDSWREQIGAWAKESRPAWARETRIEYKKSPILFITAEIGMPTYRTAVVDVMHNDEELWLNLDLLEERRERAAIRKAKAKLKMTKYYNARVRGVTFRLEDFVYHSNKASHAVDKGKLGPKWEGPYEVTEALGDGAYRLRSMDGTVLLRTWNIANLKKCYL